jgi:hypothetical protein
MRLTNKENMSTNYETSDPSLTLTSFWGGDDRGVCIQITADPLPLVGSNCIQLTKAQAFTLALEFADLVAQIYGEGV